MTAAVKTSVLLCKGDDLLANIKQLLAAVFRAATNPPAPGVKLSRTYITFFKENAQCERLGTSKLTPARRHARQIYCRDRSIVYTRPTIRQMYMATHICKTPVESVTQ
mmetsp:Transcript_35083/g.58690  ORF Transcript_35083/g.58690 Transcript_35083/m.58690 type:complete len:108 (-) Transcript_35083:145-468(-)